MNDLVTEPHHCGIDYFQDMIPRLLLKENF